MSTLTPETAERWKIDLKAAQKNADELQGSPSLVRKVQEVHAAREFPPISDPDQNLYGGGFFSDRDRSLMNEIVLMSPKDLARTGTQFEDPRLPEMLFRYRARNWPKSLSKEERERWNPFRHDRLSNPDADSGITLAQYQKQLAKMVMQPEMGDRERKILSDLADWPAAIAL